MAKAIIFDFDGVLVDSVNIKTNAFATLYKQYGPRIVEQVVEYHLMHGGISRYEKFKYYHKNLLGMELTKEKENALGGEFSNLVESAIVDVPWISGAKEFLDKYYRQIALFIASGTPDKELNRIVKAKKMERYFKTIYGSNKKKVEIIKTILSENNYDLNDVLMVGDAMADYIGAMESGVKFLGYVSKEKKSPFPPNTLCVNDIFEYLDNLLVKSSQILF